MSLVRVYPIHERACTVQLEKPICLETFQVIEAIHQLLLKKFGKEISESILSYNSATFFLHQENQLAHCCEQFQLLTSALLENKSSIEKKPREIIKIPVCYHTKYAPDLEAVSCQLEQSEAEIIALHSQRSYQVYTIGFVPGFPYMGEVHAALQLPRKKIPVPKVAPGSVAIAGQQTGIYPIEVAGGWHIIGRTPLKLFDKSREKPCLLEAGDQVEFYQITLEEFENWNEPTYP